MGGKLVDYIFRKRVQKHLKNTARNKQFVNYEKAKNILLLFESNYSEKNPETKRIIQSLTADGKKVTAWGYVDKKNIISPAYPEYRILHPKDLGLFKKPCSQLLQELLRTEYDLLIDISTKRFIPLDYVVLHANAKCKAGMKKNNLNLYDFAVDIDAHLAEKEIQVEDLEYSFLFNQVLFYLKNIQTND
ncbi:MAG: hypothetical protein PHQ11_08470 [Paludibacter sp.]|nr:hypothetical protein [Paludibacter sp.]MDD4198316.1 hypothetical protein [Paludibacter sp.]MDD4428057.1 hypothetical protein [Paludibacter sp.]